MKESQTLCLNEITFDLISNKALTGRLQSYLCPKIVMTFLNLASPVGWGSRIH